MDLDRLTDQSPEELRALLRDLAARAAAAEASRAEAEASRAEAEASRAEAEASRAAAETRVAEERARSQDLREQLEASERVVSALMRRVTLLTRQLATLQGRPEQLALELELAAVQRRLDDLNRDTHGARSERRGRPKGSAPEEKPEKKPEKKPQTGHGPTPQGRLPRTEQLHLLDAPDLPCPNCEDRTLHPWEGRTDDSEEITVVERTYTVVVHRRQVYRCGCCGHLETALGPRRFVPGGRYSPEFAVSVAVDKYRDAIPLERQTQRMAEQGLVVTTQTLWDQTSELYPLLLPSYLALQKRILESDLVHADETPWRLMKKGGSKRWWVWGLSDGTRAFFLLAPTRGAAAARELFGDYDGVVMADRYAVYEALEHARTKRGGQQQTLFVDDAEIVLPTPDYTLTACWMHARRGFVRAARHGDVEAETALDLIAGLYTRESKAAARVADLADPAARAAALREARQAIRAAESRPLLDQLRAWADEQKPMAGSPLDDALRWMNNGWKQLSRFVSDASVPLDNGLLERLLRSVVLGRKVYAGARSEAGTRVAALFYSLIASCRLVGVDAHAYLLEATRRALLDRDAVFLPEDFAALGDGVTTTSPGT